MKQQVTALLRAAVETAVKTAGAVEGSQDAEVAHLLAKNLPQLLLRYPPGHRQCDHAPAPHNQSNIKVIRARLRAARAGDWAALIQDVLDELAAEIVDPERSPPRAADSQAPLTLQAAQSAVLRARTGALRSACAQLVGGPPVPPSEAARTMISELFPPPLDDAQAAHLTRALESAQAVEYNQRLRTTPRQIGRQLNMLKPAAGPGPSGYRNTHILCLASDPAGDQVLQAWADLWARGSIAPWLAALWTSSIARPFWKDRRQLAVRPILCGEALLKFAMGVCVLGSEKQIRAAVGTRQHGVGGSPEHVGSQVRAAAAHRPDRALLSLDLKNAFGSIRWADALDGLVASVPRLALPVARQWAQRSTKVFVQVATNAWEPIEVTGGLTQGCVEAQPVFCIVLARIIDKVLADPAVDMHADPPSLDWAFVDDWTLQVCLPKVPTFREAIVKHTAAHGLQLQPLKCQLHVPALRHLPEAQWPPELRAAAEAFPVSAGGITLLGTEATSQFETPLNEALAADQAAKRLANAQILAGRLLEVLSLTPPAGAKQAVWTLNRCVVAQALSYDYRVLPCALVAPHAESLEKAVVGVASAVLNIAYSDLTDDQCKQLHLPTRCAGLQLIRPTLVAPLARAAALMESGPLLRKFIASWPGCTEQHACRYDGVDAEVAAGLIQRLRLHGIDSIAGDGTAASSMPSLTAAASSMSSDHNRDVKFPNPFHGKGEPFPSPAPEQVHRAGLAHATQQAADLRPPVPARHLLSAMLRHVADRNYANLLAESSPTALPRPRSAAGPTAGASLVAPLSTPGISFTDEEWECALRRRLGLPPVGPLQPHGIRLCKNWNATKSVFCGVPLDADGSHAAICPCGPLTNLLHDGLCDVWCDILDETGVCTRRELYVPALSTPQKDAWLDIGSFGPGEFGQLLFDVTVRHPGAARYTAAAAATDAATAAQGSRDKTDRYGASVTALVHESWGRLNDAAESCLSSASEAAARLDWRHGRAPGKRLQRWRAILDANLQRGQAAMQQSATHGLPGKAHRHLAPGDLPTCQTCGHFYTPR